MTELTTILTPCGNFALYSALVCAFIQGVAPIIGYFYRSPYLSACARPFALAQFTALFVAYLLLTYAFGIDDFALTYVAANSHPNLPLLYKLTAVWGAHEGSILLWVLLLSVWTLTLIFVGNKRYPKDLITLSIAVLGLLNFSFLSFLILTSNPFIAAAEVLSAIDLNPLLQDPGFVIHPPMLYVGYVGFCVAFALTQAALLRNQLDSDWVQLTKQFTIAAWCFLTLGITLGSWWAYRVLGWGGFWFWDPVENASLLPWLSGTGLIHLLLLLQHHQIGKSWAVLLANMTFALSILGTFLVRSGILVSAHTFANDPARGLFLLILFCLIVAACLILFFWRMLSQPVTKTPLSPFTKPLHLLLNSALLFVAMLTILLGTLYPLIIEALHLGAISVGAPYFNKVMTPMAFIIMLAMGWGVLCEWHQLPRYFLLKRASKKMLLSLLLSCTIMFSILHQWQWQTFLTLTLSFWILLTVIKPRRLFSGVLLAHVGFALLIIGVMLSSLLQSEREVRMQPGDSATLGDYQFLFLDQHGIQGSNFRGIRAAFDVTKGQRHITNLYPEKRIYPVRGEVMTRVDIHPGIFRDLYIALGEPLNDQNEWSVRIYHKPFIRFIWTGGILMMVGGIAALAQRRKQFIRV